MIWAVARLKGARLRGAGLIVAALGLAGVALAACGDGSTPRRASAPEAITFSILSAQGQASAEPLWRPLLEDMSRAIGVPVQARFGASYDGLVDDMKEDRVQVGWFSARPAIDAIDNAGGEVIARTVDPEGSDSYRATIIVKRGAGLTLDHVLACGQRLTFGMGDARSTSGTLAPMTFLFNPRGVDPDRCFRSVRSGNHEANAFAVASGVLDAATSNSVSTTALRRQNPAVADQVEVVWQSPPIPEGGILAREDLDPALKEKIRGFFLTYGQGEGVVAERQRSVLAALRYSRFIAADESYLDPVREMAADQALSAARAKGDAAAITRAQDQLGRLRAKREVQP